jgi:hypothetical protein
MHKKHLDSLVAELLDCGLAGVDVVLRDEPGEDEDEDDDRETDDDENGDDDDEGYSE